MCVPAMEKLRKAVAEWIRLIAHLPRMESANEPSGAVLRRWLLLKENFADGASFFLLRGEWNRNDRILMIDLRRVALFERDLVFDRAHEEKIRCF